MKATCTLVASVLAASTVALSAPAGDNESNINLFPSEGLSYYRNPLSQQHGMIESQESSSSSVEKMANREKFAPRFDGLRFIETLITAHR